MMINVIKQIEYVKCAFYPNHSLNMGGIDGHDWFSLYLIIQSTQNLILSRTFSGALLFFIFQYKTNFLDIRNSSSLVLLKEEKCNIDLCFINITQLTITPGNHPNAE